MPLPAPSLILIRVILIAVLRNVKHDSQDIQLLTEYTYLRKVSYVPSTRSERQAKVRYFILNFYLIEYFPLTNFHNAYSTLLNADFSEEFVQSLKLLVPLSLSQLNLTLVRQSPLSLTQSVWPFRYQVAKDCGAGASRLLCHSNQRDSLQTPSPSESSEKWEV